MTTAGENVLRANDENSYHVVTGSGTDSTAILDGLTIASGNANGLDPDDGGGGMHNVVASPTVTNCTFVFNFALNSGGGMANKNNSNPVITNCIFVQNAAGNDGGAMANSSSTPRLVDCTFILNIASDDAGAVKNSDGTPQFHGCTFDGNRCNDNGGAVDNAGSNAVFVDCLFENNFSDGLGGAVVNFASAPTITDCVFRKNTANSDGGGMGNFDISAPKLTNCLFVGNSAREAGGLKDSNSSSTVTNCTFSGNSAIINGGGIFTFNGSSTTVQNSVFWGNSDGGGMDESAQVFTSSVNPLVTFCDIQGLVTGGIFDSGANVNNIGLDPLFVDPDGDDNTPGTEDDNLRLMPGSPCIDAADNDVDTDALTAGVQPLPPTDLDGNLRLIDDPLTEPDTGNGVPPIVDMGAYEFFPPGPAVSGPVGRAMFETLLANLGGTFIDFESLTTGTNLTNQFAGLGFASTTNTAGNPAGPFHVEVSGAFAGSNGNTIVGSPCDPGCVDDGRVGYEIVFSTPQRWAGLERLWNTNTITRFHATSGALLHEFTGLGFEFVGFISDSLDSNNWIQRIEIDGANVKGSRQVGYADDLFYSTAGP